MGVYRSCMLPYTLLVCMFSEGNWGVSRDRPDKCTMKWFLHRIKCTYSLLDLSDCSVTCSFVFPTASADKEVTIIRELGESIVLPCLDLPVNATPSVTHWKKGRVVLATHDHSSVVHPPGHLAILDNSSLSISGLMVIDEEVYHCETEPRSSGEPHSFQLLIRGKLGNTTCTITSRTQSLCTPVSVRPTIL